MNAETTSFRDCNVVITGGSSGIGFATASKVVALGGSVTIIGRSLERLMKACNELGPDTIPVQLDVTDEAAVQEAFESMDEIDHLVTAASGTLRGDILEQETIRSRDLFESKFWGQYYCIKHAAPKLHKESSVVLFLAWPGRKFEKEMSTQAAVGYPYPSQSLFSESCVNKGKLRTGDEAPLLKSEARVLRRTQLRQRWADDTDRGIHEQMLGSFSGEEARGSFTTLISKSTTRYPDSVTSIDN